MSKEPVMTLVLSLVAAGVAVLVAFGVDVTQAQAAAVGGFAAAAVGLGLFVRSRVSPVERKHRYPRHPRKGS
jgi:hypothetical protein